MAITIEDCEAIIKAEKESGQKLMIGFNLRYNYYFNTMKDIIDAGTIGEIKTIWIRHFINYGGWAYFHDYRAINPALNQRACEVMKCILYPQKNV